MLSKKTLFPGFALLCNAVLAFESPYAELASLLKNNACALGSGVMGRSVDAEKIFPKEGARPFEIHGMVDYSHENGRRHCSNGGIAFLGFDFDYDNFILKRTCSMGFFSGFAKNFIHYSCDTLKKGDLHMGFGGYYGNFHILGVDVSTLSIFGFGKSNTNCENFTANGQDFDHFTHGHRILHSKIDLYYPWKWNDLKIGPNIALGVDNLKQKGAEEWDQSALRLHTIDGIAGIRCEKNYEKFYLQLFLGGEQNIRKRWSGGEINIDSVGENFIHSGLDGTKFLATADIHFHWTESIFLDLTFSGRYGKNDKNSTIAITLNKVF
ncbi:MAG: hypothetical protein LBI77_03010 [Puniceicoccales bacterium]|jgi:hypothetical protein|nr:hypothetical protein [Puniceicoccales bacterium]